MKTVKPLKVPEPCVIDEVPEVFAFGMGLYSSDVTVDATGFFILCSRSCAVMTSDAELSIRYVAGVDE
jgi:hypothetical protein